MTSEYEYTMTVEVKAGTNKEETDKLKKFKQALYNKYGAMFEKEEVMITRIKRV